MPFDALVRETVENAVETTGNAAPNALIFQLAISLGLGFLIGLQRERTHSGFGGVRTFPLVCALGTLSAIASTRFGSWIVPFGFLSLTLIAESERAFFILSRRFAEPSSGSDDLGGLSKEIGDSSDPVETVKQKGEFGTTTTVVALATYCVGVVLANPDWTLIGVEAGAIVAVLLQMKPRLHRIAAALGETETNAITRFTIVSLIILPVLPNKNFGPFGAFNPFEAWLNVALIVGLGLAGYVAQKYYGRNAGVLFGGIVGGAVSSAATTTNSAKSVATGSTSFNAAAVVILLASATQTVRAAILEAAVSTEFFYRCAPSTAAFIAASAIPALILWRRARREPDSPISEQENPAQWRSALTFGALYVVVLFAIKASEAWFGAGGAVASVAIGGLVEMNAVALSVSRLATTDPETMAAGWKLIMIASIFSYLFKLGVAFAFAGRRFGLRVAPLFAIPCAVALALVLCVR